MYGLSAVATAVLRSSNARLRSRSARMPATHLSCSVRIASRMMRVACSVFQAITGIITLSSSWPASVAERIAASQPITCWHTWLTISGIEGLTLPGMIEEPGWTGGSWISAIPARGPMLRSRRSLATFPNSTASLRNAPE